MRTNGKLYYVTSRIEPQFDEYGVPVKGVGSEEWSDAIPCHIETLSSTSKARTEDNTFHQASYSVLVERASVPLDTSKVKLVRGKVELGVFEVNGYPQEISLDRVKLIL